MLCKTEANDKKDKVDWIKSFDIINYIGEHLHVFVFYTNSIIEWPNLSNFNGNLQRKPNQ